MTSIALIPTAQAAFIAGLSDRQINRVIDEHLMPQTLFKHQGSTRLFTRLGAAFAKFYFATEDTLVAKARRQVIDEIHARVDQLPAKDPVLTLTALDGVDWKVEHDCVAIDVFPFANEAAYRARDMDLAHQLVITDPEVMGGLPVFVGTRLPVENVLGSLDVGIDLDNLQASYPFLTPAHVHAARVFLAVHPKRGRPRRLDAVPSLRTGTVRVIKRQVAA